MFRIHRTQMLNEQQRTEFCQRFKRHGLRRNDAHQDSHKQAQHIALYSNPKARKYLFGESFGRKKAHGIQSRMNDEFKRPREYENILPRAHEPSLKPDTFWRYHEAALGLLKIRTGVKLHILFHTSAVIMTMVSAKASISRRFHVGTSQLSHLVRK